MAGQKCQDFARCHAGGARPCSRCEVCAAHEGPERIAFGGDQLALSRLKKRKLQLKDEITEINNSLLPDIIA